MNKLAAKTLVHVQSSIRRGVEAFKRQEEKHPVATYLLGGLAVGMAIGVGANQLGLPDLITQGLETGAETALDVAGFVLRETGVLPVDIPPVIDLP